MRGRLRLERVAKMDRLAGHRPDQPVGVGVGQLACLDLLAIAQDSVVVANGEHLVHLVRDEDDGVIAVAEAGMTRKTRSTSVRVSDEVGSSRMRTFISLFCGGTRDLQELPVRHRNGADEIGRLRRNAEADRISTASASRRLRLTVAPPWPERL